MLEQMEQNSQKNQNLKLIIVLAVVVAVIAGGGYWWLRSTGGEAIPPKPELQKKEVVKQKLQENEPTDQEPAAIELTAKQKDFQRYFTEAVLQDALQNAGSEYNLSMFRNLIRIAFNAEFLTDMKGMTWEKWESGRKKVRELARKQLADPVFLKYLWKQYRSVILTAIQTAGKTDTVRQLSLRAHPYFSGELSHSKSILLQDYYRLDTSLEAEMSKQDYDKKRIHDLTDQLDEKYRVLQKHGFDDDDIYLFEFSRRRLKEGGRELTEAYAEILKDLSQSL